MLMCVYAIVDNPQQKCFKHENLSRRRGTFGQRTFSAARATFVAVLLPASVHLAGLVDCRCSYMVTGTLNVLPTIVILFTHVLHVH